MGKLHLTVSDNYAHCGKSSMLLCYIVEHPFSGLNRCIALRGGKLSCISPVLVSSVLFTNKKLESAMFYHCRSPSPIEIMSHGFVFVLVRSLSYARRQSSTWKIREKMVFLVVILDDVGTQMEEIQDFHQGVWVPRPFNLFSLPIRRRFISDVG